MQQQYPSLVHEGMDVLDRDGNKIGKVGEHMPDGQSFNVDSGFLGLGKEYYVPFSAVTQVADNSVYLDAYKDEMDRRGWDQPYTDRQYTAAVAQEGSTVQLREEELQARTRLVETGAVTVGKEVVEEERTLHVPVTREEVYVERRPVDRAPAAEPIGYESETVRVPVREEQVEVEKRPVVYEEVTVGTQRAQETRQVTDTVRREEARVQREGDVTRVDEGDLSRRDDLSRP